MLYCPFCKSPIEKFWSYCHNCNKPLISNLEKDLIINEEISSNESLFYDIESQNDYNQYIIEDDKTDQELQEIEKELSHSEKSGKNMGVRLLKKASLFYKKRDFHSTLKNLKLALQNFEDENDLLNIAICHNELGLINEEMGYFDQAIYHFDRTLKILEQSEEKIKLIQVLNNIGNVYYLLNDLENSYNNYQKALNLAENEKLEQETIKTSSNLVEILFPLKDYDRIIRILKNNLDYFSNHKDVYGTILTLIKFGKAYYYLGEQHYDQSYQYLNDAIILIKKIESQVSSILKARLEWECFLYIAKLNVLWDNDNEAENYLLKSLETIRTYEIQDHINEALVLDNLARFYLIKGEDEKAIDYFSYAIDIYKKYGNEIKIAEIKKEIANIYHEFLQDIEKAKKFYEEALEIYEAESYFKESAEILDNFGEIYKSEQNIPLAILSFKKAMQYYSEIKDESNKLLIMNKINSISNNTLN
jgi:tetratricopeptide (TPR) repeat protein